jgi:glycosyltransferase involved in cell wall biosynthesis
VLASDIPQNVEGLSGNGHLFRAGDVDDLTHRLQRLLDDPVVCRSAFEPARDYVAREFNWDRTTDIIEGVYASCLTRQSSPQLTALNMEG